VEATPSRSTLRVAGLVLALAAALAPGAAAQETRTVVAGRQYEAGGLRTFFLGENYRDLWTTPVRVEVLNPDTFAGGLTVEREGGGLSTESVRMKGRNGREYVFRSVQKDVTPSMRPELRGTIPHRVAQDLVSAKNPAAALVVPPLLDAVGVLHATPRLYVMPDHPFLGTEFRQFAGRLGQVEERPIDGFAGAEDVEGSGESWNEDFREKLAEDPEHRVDAEAFLTARLMDVFFGDWDRHWDQWRWARFDRGGLKYWRAIPRDRDNAFNSSGGLIPGIARSFTPIIVRFGPRYDQVFRYHRHPSELDRRLLSGLSREKWDSTAAFLRARLTDEVIDAAVRRLPPEYHAVEGAALAAALKSRRDQLPQAAAELYALQAREVDLHSTDEPERAEITRLEDGSVDVVVHTEKDRPGEPYYRRRFVPAETREVRVFLHGGDDRALVRGASREKGVLVRVIGGGGDDELRDESAAAGGRRTVFHDDRGDNRFEPGREAKVDTREWSPPEPDSLIGNPPPPRDWGSGGSLFTPWAGWQLHTGLVLGVGPTWTRYGFRRTPYASMVALRALWAPQEGGYGAELLADFRHTNRPSRVAVNARASTFENVRFHGFGNESPEDPDRDAFLIDQTQVRAQVAYFFRDTERLDLYAGPVAKWTDPEELGALHPLSPLPEGGESFWQAGAEAGAAVDLRDSDVYPRRGAFLGAVANGFTSDFGEFGRLSADARGYAPLGPVVLALRAAGVQALGDFPFQESAFVGGPGTLRGFPYQRFRGDAALFGQAELRARLARVNLLVLRPLVGVFALADAGRVYVDGDSPGDWHTALGGGLSFEALGRSATVAYAKGEKGTLYLTLGMPF
jgi:hypothetical protein